MVCECPTCPRANLMPKEREVGVPREYHAPTEYPLHTYSGPDVSLWLDPSTTAEVCSGTIALGYNSTIVQKIHYCGAE
jgi:hypothetical protein